MHYASKYTEAHCETVQRLGKKGYCIMDVVEALGVAHQTLLRWERRYPSFAKAMKRVRENSEKLAALRFEKLLRKTEAQLEAALKRVRQKRLDEQAKYASRFGGSPPTKFTPITVKLPK